jgi:transposase
VGSDHRVADAASHPFYRRLNQLLREHGFDDFVEGQCASLYAETMGRPGVPPGIYFRLLLIGYFEGIGSERGIAWRAADSLALRDFLGVGLGDDPPDHSTISRTRCLIALETHRAVFIWVPYRGRRVGQGKTINDADAEAMPLRSIVRRDTDEDYEEFPEACQGVALTPTRRSGADHRKQERGSNMSGNIRTIRREDPRK